MDRLLQSATGTLAMLELLGSMAPTPDNVWNNNAAHLRAAIDRLSDELKGSTAATDTEAPTRV